MIPTSAVGKQLENWPNERWLDIRDRRVLDVMKLRLDLARRRGCDGVEPDNVDAYTNDSGFSLTAVDQLTFNRHLANEAHRRGLSVALKNSGDQAGELVDYFDFELNEECFAYDECDQLQVFAARGKAVLNVEYASTAAAANSLSALVCPRARSRAMRTLIMPHNLDDQFRVACF